MAYDKAQIYHRNNIIQLLFIKYHSLYKYIYRYIKTIKVYIPQHNILE